MRRQTGASRPWPISGHSDPLEQNGGFAHGCNAGWRAGSAPYVLFLNPDTRVRGGASSSSSGVLDRGRLRSPPSRPGSSTTTERSTSRSGASRACARRMRRRCSCTDSSRAPTWTDEVVRDERRTTRPGSPDWVSGACILVRRSALEQLGGLDDGFFMYCEDIDLCRRLRQRATRCASCPRRSSSTRAEPRRRGRRCCRCSPRAGSGTPPSTAAAPARVLERLGVALGALTHVVGRARRPSRRAGTRGRCAAMARRRLRASRTARRYRRGFLAERPSLIAWRRD